MSIIRDSETEWHWENDPDPSEYNPFDLRAPDARTYGPDDYETNDYETNDNKPEPAR